MSSQIDDLTAEVSKEKKLKSRSEHYSKQLEDEIEILKVNITGACCDFAVVSQFQI
jgi:peptidoglycan hydrolase CwlO-like protein